MAGRVHQINVSPGGVPKLPVPRADVTANGVEGDRQANLEVHGGPDRAVCLYSLEVIEALREEGHSIFAGAAGENLTLEGVDWDRVVPGAHLRVGPVLLEVTAPTNPCQKNAQWFVDGHFGRMHERSHPGWSRMYARVLEEGNLKAGDPAEILEGQK